MWYLVQLFIWIFESNVHIYLHKFIARNEFREQNSEFGVRMNDAVGSYDMDNFFHI